MCTGYVLFAIDSYSSYASIDHFGVNIPNSGKAYGSSSISKRSPEDRHGHLIREAEVNKCLNHNQPSTKHRSWCQKLQGAPLGSGFH